MRTQRYAYITTVFAPGNELTNLFVTDYNSNLQKLTGKADKQIRENGGIHS